MALINRRQLRFLILAGALIAIMVPITLVKSESISSQLAMGSSDWAQTASENVAVSDKTLDESSTSRDLALVPDDHDQPPATATETTPETGRNTERRKSVSDQSVASPSHVPEPTPQQAPGSEISTNRSVVGWSSASIANYQPGLRSAPESLTIPSLSINARVDGVSVDSNGAMEIPDDRDTVGWYRHGSAPGEAGTSVIAGHLDDAYGRSVFFDLSTVEKGASIEVMLEDGNSINYRVVEKVAYDATDLPSKTLFSREGNSRLALITCGGEWDRSAGRYTKTVVVYAEPTSTT